MPFDSLLVVLGDTPAIFISQAKLKLCKRVVVFSSLVIPVERLLIVLRDTQPY